VTRLLPQRAIDDLRRLHFLVAMLADDPAHVLLDLLPQRPTLGMPEHHARCLVLDMEEIELATELAVVALLSLLDHVQVGVEFVLLCPCRAIHTLQHLVLRVAPPIGSGQLGQLENLELTGRRHMRPATQVDEIALSIERDILIGRNRGNDLRLVVLADTLEELHRLVARPYLAMHLDLAPGDLVHARLDRGDILRRKRALVREVVVKAVIDDRADGDLRLREELLHRVRKQVRRGMANDLQPVLGLVGNDRQCRICLQTMREID